VRHPLLVSLLVVVAGTVACAKTKVDALPPIVPTVPTTTTTLVDYSTVPLAAVASNTTTTVNQGPGRARLSGTVVGPDGAVVPLAVVRVERLQDDAVVFRGDIVTDAEGKWRTGRLVGGRWRARAWRTPDLADVRPDTVYLEASESKSLQLKLDRYGAPAVTASIAPDPPIVGAQANIAVAVTSASVDAEGIVRSTPVPNLRVQLVAPNFAIANPNAVLTDADGHVTWLVSCTLPGPSGMFVNMENGTPTGAPQPFTVSPCTEPPPPPQPPAPPTPPA